MAEEYGFGAEEHRQCPVNQTKGQPGIGAWHGTGASLLEQPVQRQEWK